MIYLYTKFHWPEYGSLAIAIQTKATHTHTHAMPLSCPLTFNNNITLKMLHIYPRIITMHNFRVPK